MDERLPVTSRDRSFRSAGILACRIAGFPACEPPVPPTSLYWPNALDLREVRRLKTGDTAGWQACATVALAKSAYGFAPTT